MDFSKLFTVTALVVFSSLSATAETKKDDETEIRKLQAKQLARQQEENERKIQAELEQLIKARDNGRLLGTDDELLRQAIEKFRSGLLGRSDAQKRGRSSFSDRGSNGQPPSIIQPPPREVFRNGVNADFQLPSIVPPISDRNGFLSQSVRPPPPADLPPDPPDPPEQVPPVLSPNVGSPNFGRGFFFPRATPGRVGSGPGSGAVPNVGSRVTPGTGTGAGAEVPRAANSNAPIDDEGNLLVDATFGIKDDKGEDQEKKVRERLAAVAFAINSVNTTTGTLLKVEDLMKTVYPPSGKFKKGETGSAKVKLSDYLTAAQIETLRTVLGNEPMNCAKVRTVNERPRRGLGEDQNNLKAGAEPLRADIITKAILEQKNYYEMLGLNNNRAEFERNLEIPREFDVDGGQKDLTDNSVRLLLKPGQSGITHPNTQRLVVLHKTPSGRLVIRTGDVDKDEASREDRDFVQRPATAKPTASEEIWELPNGMRAYSARNGDGTLVTQVPHGLVTKEITNPVTCFECHGGSERGYIVGSGKEGSVKFDPKKPPKRTRVVNEPIGDDSFGNQNIFRAQWVDYMKEIAPANARYKAALEDAGDATAGTALKLIRSLKADSDYKALAKELGAGEDQVKGALLSPRLRSAWDPDYDPQDNNQGEKKLPSFTRTVLERKVNVTRDGDKRVKRSLYCAVRDSTSDQFSRAAGAARDAVVKQPGSKAPLPSGGNHEDKTL